MTLIMNIMIFVVHTICVFHDSKYEIKYTYIYIYIYLHVFEHWKWYYTIVYQ